MALVPFSLKDAPSFIERTFPAQRVSIEAQTERKANAGQTLTALGSYWKGRKPLVLVRACILGSLLPATEQPEKDLAIFELLMAMDDEAFVHRAKKVSVADVEVYGGELADQLLDGAGKWKVKGAERQMLLGRVLARMPYSKRLDKRSLRPEECPASIYEGIWDRVNGHLGTSARSHAELVEQLGILRFGHRPKVGDTFAGGGSIPFEAARVGCDVAASDLNPVACMLTWGAFHVIGASDAVGQRIGEAQKRAAAAVDAEITNLGIEHDGEGNRAKAFLYCVEVMCPETGYRVPLAPAWVISVPQRCVAVLVPDRRRNRFDLEIRSGVDKSSFAAAAVGTVQNNSLVYTLDGKEHRTSLQTLRGDRRTRGDRGNSLREWESNEVAPRPEDLFGERLYCIQWSAANDGERTFYRAPTADDLRREEQVGALVKESLATWQRAGWVPDMKIEPGSKTDEPIRTRGWVYWHQLFNPRQLHQLALYQMQRNRHPDPIVQGALALVIAKSTEWNSRLCRWDASDRGGRESRGANVFFNQALNTLWNYVARGFTYLQNHTMEEFQRTPVHGSAAIHTLPAAALTGQTDIFLTDPPYADAVAYDEISEFFIAWLRKNPPTPFADWTWDSRRDLAIKGSGDDFRREMVRAYSAMTQHMPDNGLQIVMFTHQDGGVWADMANIFWGAGLKVTAAWYIATETTSELKKGGYVQGTVILVLRKRLGKAKTYTNEVVEEVRQEVAHQIETLTGLNQSTRAGRDENLFNDADLQMAGFAAALRVLTAYTHIDDQDMTREALRPRVSGESRLADRVIEHAVQIANEYLVPEGLEARIWDRLSGSERFYLRMLDVEEAGAKKLDSYQNFAKALKVRDFGPLMASQKPNEARLKSAAELKKAELSGSEFGTSTLRAVLFALYELQREVEPDEVLSHLRDTVPDYLRKREDVKALARYLDLKLAKARPAEAAGARVLLGLVTNEKVGG